MNSCYLKFAGNSARSKLYIAIISLLPGVALALPQNGKITAGSADISVAGETMDVEQHSDKVILEFENYDVSSGETVIYRQPSVDSVALNRVTGNDLSEIHGNIKANGQVFLLNPNGVLFGEGAQVNVGGLLVSTQHLDDRDFLDGTTRLEGGTQAVLENRGSLSAQGSIVFSGADIRNNGRINAHKVQMHATRATLVAQQGSEIPLLEEVPDSQSSPARLQNDGVIRAYRAQQHNGEIVLTASSGDILHDGLIQASEGTVEIQSQRYSQTGDIDVSGAERAGRVDILTDHTTVLHDGSRIDANARQRGDGGEVNVISEGAARFASGAKIHAEGSGKEGNGGFVEVSGHQYINVAGEVRVGASHGKAGLWYIDPTDVEIGAFGNSDGGFTGSDPFTWTFDDPPPATAQIDINALVNTLRNNGDVLVDTASAASGQGDLTVSTGFSFDGIPTGRTLSLRADRNIVFQNGVTINDVNPGTEYINLNLTANGNIDLGDSTLQLGDGSFSATAQGHVRMGSLSNPLQAGDLSVDTSGQIVLRDAGVATSRTISLTAEDIVNASGGRLLFLETPELNVDTAASGGNLDLATLATSLSITNRGSNALIVSEVDHLTVTSARPISGSIEIYSGADSDLSFDNEVDLSGMNGALTFVSNRDVLLNGSLHDTTGDNVHDVPVSITALNNLIMAPGVVVDAGTGNATLVSQTGDIQLAQVNGGAVELDAASNLFDNNSTDLNVRADTLSISANSGLGDGSVPFGADASDLTLTSINGDVHYRSAGSVNLAEASVQGDISFSLPSGDLQISQESPGLTGVLQADLNDGRMLIPAGGLILPDSLTVQADSVASTDGSAASIVVPTAELTFAATDNATQLLSAFDALTLTVQGAQSVTIEDDDALQVNALQNSGTVTLSSGTNTDLTISDTAPAWGDHVTLNAGQNLVLPTGLAITPTLSLSITSQQLGDGATALDITTEDLSLTLNSSVSTLLQTQVNQVSLLQQGEGGITINNSGSLLLNQLQSSGDITANTSADLQVIESTPAVDGELRLITQGGGNLTIADEGLSTTGDLWIEADHLRSNNDEPLSLDASDLHIALREDNGPLQIGTDLGSLTLDYAGNSAVTISNSGAMTVESAQSGGALTLSTDTGDLTLSSAPQVSGQLSLSAGGNSALSLPAGRLTHNDALSIDSGSVTTTGEAIELTAESLQLNWRDDTGPIDLMLDTNGLDVQFAGTSALAITNTGALTVNSAITAGDFSVNTTEGNLILAATPQVAGTLVTNTVGSGDLLIPVSGVSLTGAWIAEADRLINGEQSSLALQAPRAEIHLRAGNAAQTWDTQFQELSLINDGTGAISVNNTGGLSLNALQSGGDTAIGAAGGDLLVQSSPLVDGQLSLTTSGDANLTLPTEGLEHTGRLIIDAANLSGSTGDFTAEQLDITLRDGAQSHQITGTIGELSMQYGGTSSLNVVTSGDLSIANLSAEGSAYVQTSDTLSLNDTQVAGELSLVSGSDLSILSGEASFGGTLNVTAAGTVSVHADGIQADNLVLQAASLANLSGGSVRLDGTNASLDIRNQADLALTTSLDQLGLQFSGERLQLSNNRDLHLLQLQAEQLDQLTVDVDGTLRVPQTGLRSATRMNLNAEDLIDNDRTVNLFAPSTSIHLTQSSGNNIWQVQAEQLDTSIAGPANLTLESTTPLALTDLNNDGYAARVDNGDLAVNVTGDLRVDADILTRDATPNDVSTGRLALNVQNGNVVVGSIADVSLVSDRSADTPQSPDDFGIAIRVNDSAAEHRSITLGTDTATATLIGQGADVLLDPRSGDTPEEARRTVSVSAGSLVRVFNDPDDPATGQVIINGVNSSAKSWQLVHQDRRLVINLDNAQDNTLDPTDILDEVDDMEDRGGATENPSDQSSDSDSQFVKVFGQCDELDPESRSRCRIESALKSFLSHWLVGGEMPPKTEIR